MRARKQYIQHDTSGEFELDLAPLLAVMVKLVPVLLLSSAFVQLMMIETELPQIVKEAVQQNEQNPTAKIVLEIDAKSGARVVIEEKGQQAEVAVPLKDGAIDLPALHQKLVEVKRAHPEVFRIDLRPAGAMEYGDIVKVMDEARRARDGKVTFPVMDKQTGKEAQTPYMFPEIVFANSLEG